MKRTVSILLLTIFFLSFGAAPAAAAPDRQILRIGLAYGGNAKPSANLANEVGEGYAFGYFEADYSFVPLAQTSYGKITVLKNKLMYIGSDKKYYDTAPSSVSAVIGPYRVQPAASPAPPLPSPRRRKRRSMPLPWRRRAFWPSRPT